MRRIQACKLFSSLTAKALCFSHLHSMQRKALPSTHFMVCLSACQGAQPPHTERQRVDVCTGQGGQHPALLPAHTFSRLAQTGACAHARQDSAQCSSAQTCSARVTDCSTTRAIFTMENFLLKAYVTLAYQTHAGLLRALQARGYVLCLPLGAPPQRPHPRRRVGGGGRRREGHRVPCALPGAQVVQTNSGCVSWQRVWCRTTVIG